MTTNEFAFKKWAYWAGERQVAQYRVQDIRDCAELNAHWFSKIHIAILKIELFFCGLAQDFWSLFWSFETK